jgi:predicted NBD/HSP70 family sugar kinase
MLVTVDTGGTKTLVASFADDGILNEQFKFETPHNEHEYIEKLRSTIEENYNKSDITALVIALPGRIDHSGVLVVARNLGWADIDIKQELSAFFDCPILVENDANLAGLAEARQLSPVPVNCLYITVSTGIGTGLITDGHINPHYSQSEGGQIVVEYKGKLQRWEGFASGHAIYETYGLYAHDITDENTWREIAEKISRGLLVLTPILRPDIIIIGGSIGTYFDHYSAHLNELLHEQLHYVPPIVEAKHPEQAVIYGCYYYALDTLANSAA